MDTGFNIFEPQPHLQAAAAAAAAAPPARPRRRRRVLLASVAVLAVAGAGGAFLLSPYNTFLPVGTVIPGLQVRHPPAQTSAQTDTSNARTPNSPSTQANAQAAADAAFAPVVAPAARLAGVPRQERGPAVRGTVAPTDADAQTREILALRGGSDKQASATPAGAAETAGGRAERATPTPKPSGPAAPAVSEVGVSPLQTSPLPAPSVAAPAPSQPEPTGLEPGMAAPAPLVTANPVPPAARLSPPPMAFHAPSRAEPWPSPPAVDPAPVEREADPAGAPPQRQDSTDAAQPGTPAPSGLPPPVVTVVAPRPATPAAADPVGTGMALRPKPMARGEQIDVLHVVSQLATMIRDLRMENAGLRSSTKATSDKVDTAVADFERRLALAESRVAVKAAMADMDAPPESAVPSPSAARALRRAKAAAAQPATPPDAQTSMAAASVPAGATRYKVQAASPGLAMLSELDRSGGDGSQRQVKVGDQVPGYGRVVAIQQQGVAWTVKTEHGAIQ